MNTLVSHFTVPAEHPALPGHFPGRPIVPAVVLLESVLDALPARGQWTLRSVLKAKFLQPVLPGESIELRIELADSGGETRANFQGLRAAMSVFEGRLLLTRREDAA